jgi:hypothetical protein
MITDFLIKNVAGNPVAPGNDQFVNFTEPVKVALADARQQVFVELSQKPEYEFPHKQ